MKTLGKTIIVNRGETFVLSRKVFKDDGITPYVLSTSIVNPYLIITVSSSTYRVNGGYKINFWLDLSTYPSFRRVTPELLDISYVTEGNDNYNKLPKGYKEDAKDCIFYTMSSSGQKDFYYYTGSEYRTYSFVFTKQFLNITTRDWIESQYQYEFKIVGGQKTLPHLLNVYKGIYPYINNVPDDPRTLYYEIRKCRPDLVRQVRYSAPLVTYFTEDVLQRPEKLIIKANC